MKFEILEGVLNNIFFTQSQKDDFFAVFSRAQRTYKAIAKFARICEVRRSNVQITEDLYMNPIEESDKKVLRIYQKKANYLFTARDLVNIVNKSLTNNQDYFCDPLPIKNPYTNVTFSYATLYNIYFFIRQSTMIMPQLFHSYFINNFNLTKFAVDNECALRDECIRNYVFSTPSDYLYDKIIYMIMSNPYTQKWILSSEFDRGVLVQIMLPYFYLNEIAHYSLNPDKKCQAMYELDRKFKSFYNFNPLFGRKVIIPHSNGRTTINQWCPDFHRMVIINDVIEEGEEEEEEEVGTVILGEDEEEEEEEEEEDEED